MASGPGTGTVFSVRWESVLSASGFNYLCTEKISGGRKREQEDKMCALSKNWLIWLPSALTSARPQVSTQKAGLGSSGAPSQIPALEVADPSRPYGGNGGVLSILLHASAH